MAKSQTYIIDYIGQGRWQIDAVDEHGDRLGMEKGNRSFSDLKDYLVANADKISNLTFAPVVNEAVAKQLVDVWQG